MEFAYKGTNDRDSKCDIEIIVHPDYTVVICSELPDNPGTNITHWCEHLAYEVCEAHIDFERLVWIEHYPEQGHLEPETYHSVGFNPSLRSHIDRTLGYGVWLEITPDDVLRLRAGGEAS